MPVLSCLIGYVPEANHSFLIARVTIPKHILPFENPIKVLLIAEYAKLYCPNSQLPEVDNNGAVKQCLPGHEELCGPGYSCYFSGTNYQCCPIEDEINLDSLLECPSPSITILTDAGLPLICTPGLQDCPQSSMQCLNVGKHSICCEGLAAIIKEPRDALPSKELTSSDETIQPIALSNDIFNAPNLECPEPAFTILDGNGDPVSCSEEDCAHQAGRFCYKPLNTPICCEGEERTIDDDALIKKILQENKREKEGSIEWSILKYTPLATAQRQMQQNKLLQQSDNRLGFDGSNIAKSPVPDRSASKVKQTILEVTSPTTIGLARHSRGRQIDNDYKNSQPSVVPDNAKASQTITTTSTPTTTTTATTTSTATVVTITSTTSKSQLFRESNDQSLSSTPEESQKDEIETIRYKPHNAGGYAVSRAFSSKIRRAPSDLRALARKYLLEHIRRGWPYSDEFYRTYTPFESEPGQEEEIIFHEQT
uniref:Uncharacterized protein n=1 Tax=Elaeophora elaphi TaxID=1147741 RepID=A0A158Q7H1_9BILA